MEMEHLWKQACTYENCTVAGSAHLRDRPLATQIIYLYKIYKKCPSIYYTFGVSTFARDPLTSSQWLCHKCSFSSLKVAQIRAFQTSLYIDCDDSQSFSRRSSHVRILSSQFHKQIKAKEADLVAWLRDSTTLIAFLTSVNHWFKLENSVSCRTNLT